MNNQQYGQDHHPEDSEFDGQYTTPQHPTYTRPIITHEPDAIKLIKYAKLYDTQPEGFYQSMVNGFGKCFGSLGIIPCCFCFPAPYVNVNQGYVGLITKFGELARVVDPGSTYVNPFSESIYQVSIKTEVQDIPNQACLTKDNVIVNLKSVIYYNIIDPQKAVFGISDIHNAMSERTQTTLRDVIGSRLLQEVIERREQIAEAIQEIITTTAADWGVQVESILIKDLTLDQDVSKSLSQAAQSKRVGEAKIITAKAEVESAKLMRQAADILASKPAMQIRYLDAMQNMARSAGSKVIFMPGSTNVGEMGFESLSLPEGDSEFDDNWKTTKKLTTDKKSAEDGAALFGDDDVIKQAAIQESLNN